MGILKKIFGAVFGLLAAIAGLVGIGKQDNYFLELSPKEAAQKTADAGQKVAAQTSNAVESAVEAAAPVAQQVQQAAAKVGDAANSIAPAQVSQKSKREEEREKAKQEKLAAREAAKKAKEEAKRIEAEKAAEKKAEEEAIAAAKAEAIKKMGFAEIARTPIPTMRTRRPGPSIDKFKDIAKEIKV